MTSEPPLYERDPQAWREHLAEGNRNQARKRVGADVVFRNENGAILVVEPRYKPHWDLPGGMAEANEPPLKAATREISEELGLTWTGGRLLVIDWVPPHDPWDDSLMFVFDGGVLTSDAQRGIILKDGELAQFDFVAVESACAMVHQRLERRIKMAMKALSAGNVHYLHDGHPVSPDPSPHS